MFFLGFLIAVAIVIGLTLFGAWMARRSPGTSWERREDHPMLGGPHDY